MDRKAMIALAGERAVAYRESGLHCAEAVIRGVAEALGVAVDERLLLVAAGLTGGGERYQDRCGALAGGSMLIGAIYGRRLADEDNTCPSDLVRRLHEQFQKTFGTTVCRLIVRPTEGGYAEHCTPEVYRWAGEKTAELILQAHLLCYTCEEFRSPVERGA